MEDEPLINPRSDPIRDATRNIYLREFIGINSGYSLMFAMFLIILSAIDIKSRPGPNTLLPCIWLISSGTCAFLCHVISSISFLNQNVLLKLMFNSTYLFIYFCSAPLSIYLLTIYGIYMPFTPVLVCLCFLLDTSKIFYIMYRVRNRDFEHQLILTLNLNEITYSEDLETPNESCVICLEGFKQDDVCVKLTCNHIFHKDCIIPWVSNAGTCPICRDDLLETGVIRS